MKLSTAHEKWRVQQLCLPYSLKSLTFIPAKYSQHILSISPHKAMTLQCTEFIIINSVNMNCMFSHTVYEYNVNARFGLLANLIGFRITKATYLRVFPESFN